MSRTWNYLVNPFEVATSRSFRAMKKIGDYTLAALRGHIPPTPPPALAGGRSAASDSIYLELYDKLTPLVDDFDAKYSKWIGQLGIRKGQTSQLAEKMILLRGIKIEDWDLEIQRKYRMGTPGYTRLLPNRRAPFQQGSYQDRLSALQAFNSVLANDPEISEDMKEDVNLFYLGLKDDLFNRDSEKSTSQTTSKNVEAARKALSVALYGIMARLMANFENDPEQVAAFFDLETIRNHEQSVFRVSIAPNESVLVLTRTFKAEDELRLVNDGDTTLKFYLVANEVDGPGEKNVSVAANTEELTEAGLLGDVKNRLLKVTNESSEGAGHCMVVLV